MAGAEKINLNSAAVRRPSLIAECANAIGVQSTVLSMDIRQVTVGRDFPSGYEVVIDGGRVPMALDALEWALRCEELGAGELVVNSIDADGTRSGYELNLTRMISEAVSVPVIASGGAGLPQHLTEVLTKGKADAALVASMVHYGDYTCSGLKQHLHNDGIKVRLHY